MELNQEILKDLEVKFEKFKDNLANTQSESLKEKMAFLGKYTPNPAFQYWALMYLDRKNNMAHTQNLAAEIWELKDRINELLGRGNEVIRERDELQAYVKEHCPKFKSQLKWVVGIPEEPDSAPEYFPAESKQIAQRVINRYKKMMTNRFKKHPDIAETINNSIHIALWHGTDEEFEALTLKAILEGYYYDEAWFKKPMCNCRSAADIKEAFREEDIVHCFNGVNELITDSIEEAKRFYGVA